MGQLSPDLDEPPAKVDVSATQGVISVVVTGNVGRNFGITKYNMLKALSQPENTISLDTSNATGPVKELADQFTQEVAGTKKILPAPLRQKKFDFETGIAA